jgi:tetratricopeptide (TPR) repeat protein
MKQTAVANHRQDEARQVSLKLALALSAQEEHRWGPELTSAAYELSSNDQDRAVALIQQGLCYLDLGELKKADQTLQLSARYSSDPGLVAFHRGRVQLAWRDEIEALERFDEALSAGSEAVPPWDLHFLMALSHINLEEYDDARPHLDQASAPGKEAPVRFYRGVCDYYQGRVEEAKAHFEGALDLGPAPEDQGRVLYYLAASLKELGHFEEAVAELGRAVEVDPEDLANHNLLGYCYYKLGRHEEAVGCFLRAVTIDPESAIDWANLGSNLRDLGRINEAVTMYRKALSLDPTIGFARKNLTRLVSMGENTGGPKPAGSS